MFVCMFLMFEICVKIEGKSKMFIFMEKYEFDSFILNSSTVIFF